MSADLYVIVQAGGRGSRLRHHTWNKPKCLVSVRGKPLLYYLFDKFQQAKFIIIGDYAYDQLQTYLIINPPCVSYQLIRSVDKGTASGLAMALQQVPQDCSLVLTWSDLIIGDLPVWPENDKPVVCTTSAFTCRWSVGPDGHLHESPTATNGIPGLFYFPKASLFPLPPLKGEFVKWFATNVHDYDLLDCPNLEELGDFSSIEENNDRVGFCRFFNKVEIADHEVVKTVINSDYQKLHEQEVAWYRQALQFSFHRVPKIYSESPLTMERIRGHHAYQMLDLTARERRVVLSDYLDALISLHDKASILAVPTEIHDVYFSKTVSRVQSIAKIIPGFEKDSMTINGKKCRNIFSEKHKDVLKSLMIFLQVDNFVPIHGDPTFSNTLVDDKLRVWFIDPRGYFLNAGIMGDPWYDFAKVYYSAVGGYDIFNRRKFKLHIDDETVEVLMEEPFFLKTAENIFSDYFGYQKTRIQLLHGLIWLGLSGYVKDDIDSVIGSFYLGLYWLEIAAGKL